MDGYDKATAVAGRQDDSANLVIENLVKRYGDRLAVDSLSFIARPGEILGFLGPNGAGKSTTFLALTGLLRADAGRFVYQGKELGPSRGRTIALIPETPEVIPMLSVWEHLVYVAKLNRLPPAWTERGVELLARLGLQEYRDTLGHALSKGLRQRTLIAATVLLDAPILLLDEPMIGLDPRAQRELKTILAELRDRGKIVIVSTHMLSIAETMCDRLLILQRGKLVAAGTAAELRALHTSSLEDLFLEITTVPSDA